MHAPTKEPSCVLVVSGIYGNVVAGVICCLELSLPAGEMELVRMISVRMIMEWPCRRDNIVYPDLIVFA